MLHELCLLLGRLTRTVRTVGRDSVFRRSINRCCISLAKEAGRTRRSWARFARYGAGDGAAWTIGQDIEIRASRNGRSTQSALHANIAALGKQDNCQVAVMLSLVNHHASLPVAYHLYLPKAVGGR